VHAIHESQNKIYEIIIYIFYIPFLHTIAKSIAKFTAKQCHRWCDCQSQIAMKKQQLSRSLFHPPTRSFSRCRS